jgi:hypothetical protein
MNLGNLLIFLLFRVTTQKTKKMSNKKVGMTSGVREG